MHRLCLCMFMSRCIYFIRHRRYRRSSIISGSEWGEKPRVQLGVQYEGKLRNLAPCRLKTSNHGYLPAVTRAFRWSFQLLLS